MVEGVDVFKATSQLAKEAEQDPSVDPEAGVIHHRIDDPSITFVTKSARDDSVVIHHRIDDPSVTDETTALMSKAPKEAPEDIFNAPVLFGLVSAICASLAFTGTKMVTNPALSPGTSIPPGLLILLRGAVGMPFTLLQSVWWEENEHPFGTWDQVPLLFTTGLLVVLGFAAWVFGVEIWGSASVACISNASPALTVLLAGLIWCIPDLYEPLELRSCCMLMFAIMGIIFVSRPAMAKEVADDAGVGPMLAVVDCSRKAVGALVVRKIPGKPSAASITFYGQASMVVLGTGLVVFDIVQRHKQIVLNWSSAAVPIVGMILVALGGNGSDYFRNLALRESKSVMVVSMQFAVAPFCFMEDMIMVAAAPHAIIDVSNDWSYVGCAIIVIAGIMLLIIKQEKEQKEDSPAETAFLPRG